MEDHDDIVMNIAHRGGAGLSPENTLAAFRNAIALGCDAAELDVQLTRDGAVIVHHDATLNPDLARDKSGAWLEGWRPRIRDLLLEEVRRFDVGRARPGSAYAAAHPDMVAVDGEKIPTLEEVIGLAKASPHPFTLFIELKAGDDAADPVKLADAVLPPVRDAGFLDSAIFIGFEWTSLAHIRALAPSARIACNTDRNVPGNDLVLEAIKTSGAEGWLPHHSQVTEASLDIARAHGLKVAPWTVNTTEEMARLLLLGVEGICTDRPDLLKTFE